MSFAPSTATSLAAGRRQPRRGSTSPAGCIVTLPTRRRRPGRRGRLRGRRRDRRRLARRAEGALLRRAQARRRRRRDRRLPLHRAGRRRAADRPRARARSSAIRRQGKSDLLVLSAETEQWLRDGYRARMHTDAVLRDLGPILAHGEPDDGIGQGESTDAGRPAQPRAARRRATRRAARAAAAPRARATAAATSSPSTSAASAPRPRPRHEPRARTRLAALAAAAGYAPDTLLLIAEAALPTLRPGERLDDPRSHHVTSAVEVLAQCGFTRRTRSRTRRLTTARRYRDGRWREQLLARAAAHRHRCASTTRASTASRRARPTPRGSPHAPAAPSAARARRAA